MQNQTFTYPNTWQTISGSIHCRLTNLSPKLKNQKLLICYIFHKITYPSHLAEIIIVKRLIQERTQDTLLRSWIRRCMTIISSRWLRTSSKFTWEEVKRQPESLEYGQSGWGRFVQIKAPPSLPRKWSINMDQSTIQNCQIDSLSSRTDADAHYKRKYFLS